MIIESGVVIFIGLLFLFIKLTRVLALRLLGHPLALDLVVSVVAYVLHWGTLWTPKQSPTFLRSGH